MRWGLCPFVYHPVDVRRILATNDLLLDQHLHPSLRSAGGECALDVTMLAGQGFCGWRANRGGRIANRQALQPLRPARGKGAAEDAVNRFPYVMHLLEAEGIHKSAHIHEQLVY